MTSENKAINFLLLSTTNYVKWFHVWDSLSMFKKKKLKNRPSQLFLKTTVAKPTEIRYKLTRFLVYSSCTKAPIVFEKHKTLQYI